MLKPLIVSIALTTLALSPAMAAKHDTKKGAGTNPLAAIQRLGGTGPWEAYVDDAPGGKICYLIGKPKTVQGGHAKREDVRVSVTHRPADKVANVVNFILGFQAKKGSDASLDIDGHKYPLFTDKNGAWTRNAATDRAVVIAMTKGRLATIEAIPEHGGPATDTYDLNGFTATVKLIDKACGVHR